MWNSDDSLTDYQRGLPLRSYCQVMGLFKWGALGWGDSCKHIERAHSGCRCGWAYWQSQVSSTLNVVSLTVDVVTSGAQPNREKGNQAEKRMDIAALLRYKHRYESFSTTPAALSIKTKATTIYSPHLWIIMSQMYNIPISFHDEIYCSHLSGVLSQITVPISINAIYKGTMLKNKLHIPSEY